MPYDPQRSRHRPEPTDDQLAPVDALLDAASDTVDLPEGVEIAVTEAGEVVVHTLEADVEITASGDDVLVVTDDASVEVRAEADEVVVTAGGEDVLVDTTPWSEAYLQNDLDEDVEGARRSRRLRLLIAALVAAVLAAMVAGGVRRSVQKRRS